jgi:hypothetical protein
MATLRVTVTLPPELVREMDRRERNRSRFVLEAVRRELARRRKEQLRLSLERVHPGSMELAAEGLEEWGAGVSGPGADGLLVRDGGTSVRWVHGEGFTEREA